MQISAVGQEVLLSKKRYAEPLRVLTRKLQMVCREFKTTTCKLSDGETNMETLERYVHLLTSVDSKVADLQIPLTAKAAELASAKEKSVEKDAALRAKTEECAWLRAEIG